MEMTIEVSGLAEATIEKLGERAKTVGTTMPDYVRYLIEDDVSSPMNLRVLFAPVREQIQADGISDEELENLIEEIREEVHQEKLERESK